MTKKEWYELKSYCDNFINSDGNNGEYFKLYENDENDEFIEVHCDFNLEGYLKGYSIYKQTPIFDENEEIIDYEANEIDYFAFSEEAKKELWELNLRSVHNNDWSNAKMVIFEILNFCKKYDEEAKELFEKIKKI